jgi:hypothetical protein
MVGVAVGVVVGVAVGVGVRVGLAVIVTTGVGVMVGGGGVVAQAAVAANVNSAISTARKVMFVFATTLNSSSSTVQTAFA